MLANAQAVQAAVTVPEGTTSLWTPFPGFQTRACQSGSFELFLGGAKGPGKTDIVVALALRQVHKALHKAVLARSTFKEVQELIDRATRLYKQLPEKPQWRGDLSRFNFPSGAYVAFTYMENATDAENWQGKEPTFFAWDEFGKAKDPRAYELMLGELRCPDPTMHLQAVTTGNPGQRNHAYIKRRFIEPCGPNGGRVFYRYRLPNGQTALKSREWIPGRVWDNPIYANDPQYIATLMAMPERDRRYLLDGSWESPDGLAFSELDRHIHMCKPFVVPAHWPMFGGHDWGYAHPWVMIYYAVDEDGAIWVVDTVWGRKDKDSDIATKVARRTPLNRINITYAGTDVFAQVRARREETDAPTTADRYRETAGWLVTNANTDRDLGFRTLRELIAWRGRDGIPDKEPRLRFMDTPGNQRLFLQLEALTTDPDDPEDVLKVDADAEGRGGDDGYDALRYGVHSRPRTALSTYDQRTWSIHDPAVMRAEYERIYRPEDKHTRRPQTGGFDAIG